MTKYAVVLLNLGGPDKLESVKPFLFNLFYDPAIIRIFNPLRWLIAKLISTKREITAKAIYQLMGGKSTILAETNNQAEQLSKKLNDLGKDEFKCFVSMRYWNPTSSQTMLEIKNYQPDEILLLPLYPQFSTTTTASSLKDFFSIIKKQLISVKIKSICCYPTEFNFINAHSELILEALNKFTASRILFSAHGLPKNIIKQGDPYQWQVEQSVNAIITKLNIKDLDYQICYQSKVGPFEWLGPTTESEIKKAGIEQKPLIIVPIAFVSEHSETLVELDIEYKQLAEEYAVPDYFRVATLSINKNYIDALLKLCLQLIDVEDKTIISNQYSRICPESFLGCMNNFCQKGKLL